jgi:HTH-type transcriptional regulator, sugar sensing transcriptional regulator
MTTVIEQLQQLGFSQYEAQAYIALLRTSPLNGYELAKASGIPRPNIYPILQKLEERGVVLRIDNPDGADYLPVAPQELVSRFKQRYLGALESVSGALCEVTTHAEQPHISNLHGYSALLGHAQSIIASSQQSLLVCVWPEEVMALSEFFKQARERGVQITTLCLKGCRQSCPACQGSVFRYPIAPSGENRWLVLVSDGAEVLAGEITPGRDVLAIRTRQRMLVNLTAGYIQNSITLANVLADLGERFDALVDPQTRTTFEDLHPLQARAPWLEIMRQSTTPKEIFSK